MSPELPDFDSLHFTGTPLAVLLDIKYTEQNIPFLSVYFLSYQHT